MNSHMYHGHGMPTAVVGQKMKTRLSGPNPELANDRGRLAALKQGSVGPTMSDLQFMLENERKQHQQAYNYAHGHNDGSAPLGKPSF